MKSKKIVFVVIKIILSLKRADKKNVKKKMYK